MFSSIRSCPGSLERSDGTFEADFTYHADLLRSQSLSDCLALSVDSFYFDRLPPISWELPCHI